MIYIYLYILYYCGRNIYFEKFFFLIKNLLFCGLMKIIAIMELSWALPLIL